MSTRTKTVESLKGPDKRQNGILTQDKDERKSAQELELEKILFGNQAGFLDDIAEQKRELTLYDADDHSDSYDSADAAQSEQGNDEDLTGLADEQLFSWDTTGDASTAKSALIATRQQPVTEYSDRKDAAWEDSDDDRLVVSLASHSKLRKLRTTEAEDVINGTEYIRRLRQQFEQLQPTPDWAKPARHRKKRRRVSDDLDGEGSEVSVTDSEDSDEALSAMPLARLLQSSESLTHNPSNNSSSALPQSLRSGTIDMQRLRDIGEAQPSAVETLSFHPSVSPPLILSSGPSGLLSMHHISSTTRNDSSSQPTNNPLLTSLAVRGLAVSTARFHPSGSRIFFGGRRRFFHIWNLPTGTVSRVSRIAGNQDTQKSCERFSLSPCGRYMALVGTAKKGGGCANILDASSGQWIAQVRVEGRGGVTDLAWWGDGEGLAVLSKSGEVVEYSMQERQAVARWQDEGAAGSTVIALGGRLNIHADGSKSLGPSRWVAVGSQSGIVNLYDRAQWSREKLAATPSPRKVLEQLVTPTSMLEFSPDGQVLVMASRWKRDALKLVHLPSCTVYRNWPSSNTPLGRISSVAWAPNSKLLATGNEQGRIRLFEVRG